MALNWNLNRVVVLVGGVGGAKLAHGLAHILQPEQLTVIVNTGDDFWHYGLKICPDLDTVMYTLSGVVDKSNGWGVSGDTTAMLDALRRYGEAPWFRLGDQDMATHVLRTQAIHAGESLTAITQRLTKNLGIRHAVLPMTDDDVPTMIDTDQHGEIEFQEYFVKYRWQPRVKGVRYANIERARMTDDVIAALTNAEIVMIAPSNPWLSIAPILSLPGMRKALAMRGVPVAAVSPIVEGRALKGPAAKLMSELGYADVSARAIADYYDGVIDGFVYDQRDANERIALHGVRVLTCNTIMTNDDERAELARTILNWINEW